MAAPASTGIPVTHRAYSSVVTIITGHRATALGEKEEEEKKLEVEWEKMAGINGTLIVLMGIKNLEKIVERLIKSGKSPETYVALIERGTTKNQRTIIAALADIVEKARNEMVKPPAVIVIGDVVKLAIQKSNTLCYRK